jgi:hypothetical protein
MCKSLKSSFAKSLVSLRLSIVIAGLSNTLPASMLVLVGFMTAIPAEAGFRVELQGGAFYGPGNRGAHELQVGSLENFIVTAPLTGVIPFFNNGSEPQNVNAEVLFGGQVDGRLSDGTPINENVNAAFVIEVQDGSNGKKVKVLVASVSEEAVRPDQYGNLTFLLNTAFDTGIADKVVRLPVQFITGAVEIPKSRLSMEGGKIGDDMAGPYPSGRIFVGRLGDFDQDGFLDGVFVLAGTAPDAFAVGGGDPVFITRQFTSDLPIVPLEAGFHALNGILQNFPAALKKSMKNNKGTMDISIVLAYLTDIVVRIDAADENIRRASSANFDKKLDNDFFLHLLGVIDEAKKNIQKAKSMVEAKRLSGGENLIDNVFALVREAVQKIGSLRRDAA